MAFPCTKFPEDVVHIRKIEINGVENLIVNSKWQLIPTENPDKPFRRQKIRSKKLLRMLING